MKALVVLLFSLVIHNSVAQSLTDTLYFGNKKFPLQKVKVNYEAWQPGIVDLPVEYKELKNELRIPYKSLVDSVYAFGVDKNDSHYLVTKPANEAAEENAHIYLNSFLDTIKVKTEKLKDLKLYIKSNGKRVEFTGIRMLHHSDDRIAEFIASHVPGGKLFLFFDFFDDAYHHQKWKHSSFIITDLYYQRGYATYYFDRSFIILCE